ncbi:MAG: TetR/AcrR family transcriptional regulator [Phaeodactylibacter sp.]|nr:TetR/AcrR family transcriptional regulator [Phaeodactylibacter sp.]MCB9304277.1 TetR/AcrR family transcriptional regulator [Lewinellaceae bacterium]HQU57759.1 TetR/AcrR family transcriptional regulator [Saprospiraceae bacterium]
MKDLRRQILEKNREAMHLHGYQGLRADLVVKELAITKGAYYHYFSGKQELGYCILDELIGPEHLHYWGALNDYFGHPIEGIIERLKTLRIELKNDYFLLGSELNNLIQEMAPLDEGFQQRLQRIVEGMRLAIRAAIERGKKARLVKAETDADEVATMVLTNLLGAFSLAKAFQDRKFFDRTIEQMTEYLRDFKGQ